MRSGVREQRSMVSIVIVTAVVTSLFGVAPSAYASVGSAVAAHGPSETAVLALSPVTPSPVPTVTGTAVVGNTLTAKPGVWATGVTLKYQWFANGVAISGATASTFALSAARASTVITVKVTGTKSGYTPVTRTSAATKPVAKATLSAGSVKVTGTATAGQRLTAQVGTWTSGTTLTYQWFVGGIAVAKATGSSYVIRPVDVDRTIVVKVTGAKAGYVTRTVASASTARVVGKVYAVCSTLNADYPDGIRKSAVTGDMKSGVLKPFVGTPFVSDALYARQSIARDRDRDGIMCER